MSNILNKNEVMKAFRTVLLEAEVVEVIATGQTIAIRGDAYDPALHTRPADPAVTPIIDGSTQLGVIESPLDPNGLDVWVREDFLPATEEPTANTVNMLAGTEQFSVFVPSTDGAIADMQTLHATAQYIADVFNPELPLVPLAQFGTDGIVIDAASVLTLPQEPEWVGIAVSLQFRVYRSNTLFTPKNVLQLQGWYDAADAATITHSGGTVSQWNDKSANGRHFTQPEGAKQPAYSAGDITFDGVDDLMFHNNPYMYDLNGCDAFVVLDAPPQDDKTILGETNDGDSVPKYQILRTGLFSKPERPSIWQRQDNGTYKWNSNINSDTMFDSTTNMIYIADNNPQLAGAVFTYVNGDTFGGAFYTRTNTLTSTNMALGAGKSTTEDKHFAGTVKEIIILTSLTGPQRQKVEGYLAWKWGLAAKLPASHPWKNYPPTV